MGLLRGAAPQMPRRLLALFALFVISNSWTLVASEFGLPEVDEQEAVSFDSSKMSNANFVKKLTVTPVEELGFDNNITEIFVDVPGRVIINYVENTTTAAHFGIDVYADTANLVNQVEAGGSLLVSNRLYISLDTYNSSAVTTGYLLVEVSVYRRNSIKVIRGELFSGSLELIINDGVLFSSDITPTFTTDASGYIDYEGEIGTLGSSGFEYSDEIDILASGDTVIYVFSESPLNVAYLDVSALDTSRVYMELTSVAAVAEVKISAHDLSKAVVFVESLRASTTSIFTGGSDSVCLYVTETLQTGDYNFVAGGDGFALPGKTSPALEAKGSFTCSKSIAPERAPRDIKLPTATLTESDEVVEVSSGSSDDTAPSSSNAAASSSLTLAVVIAVLAALVFNA